MALTHGSPRTTFSDISFAHTSSTEDTSSSTTLSEMEAAHYYAGLPSCARLLARTSSILWQKSKGLETYRPLKQLGVLVNHTLNTTR